MDRELRATHRQKTPHQTRRYARIVDTKGRLRSEEDGYTNEAFVVFDKLPTIVFDDFTTASKYVDFRFKAKSAAMKMLILKDNSYNLKFLFEIMQVLRFQVGDNKRHWLGDFQNLDIKVPSLSGQEGYGDHLIGYGAGGFRTAIVQSRSNKTRHDAGVANGAGEVGLADI